MLAIGYFIPGIRHLMALVAGSSKMRYPVFAGFAYTGGVIWSLTFVSLGYYLGESWGEVRNHRLFLALIAALVIVLILIFWYVKARMSRHRSLRGVSG
jgi:membrane protein DedA with SNARE-associated domain